LPHEPADASNADLHLVFLDKVAMNARCSVRTSRARMKVLDALEQPRVFD
jgi:hypothetical protein